jgi:hypothetical protein
MTAYIKNTLPIMAHYHKTYLSARNNKPWSYIRVLIFGSHFLENLFPEIHSTNAITK